VNKGYNYALLVCHHASSNKWNEKRVWAANIIDDVLTEQQQVVSI
jgi:hypothetical protein